MRVHWVSLIFLPYMSETLRFCLSFGSEELPAASAASHPHMLATKRE